MKTYNNLYTLLCSFDNLILAAKKAQKGKRYQRNVSQFHFRLEENLWELKRELTKKTYVPGAYKTFYIYDPKRRMISAAPYRDRVVHHALCNLIEPIFEKAFIYHSYANRVGKGSHAAIDKYQYYAQKYPFVLKCDIRKFFPSIDHAILKQELRRKIRCVDTLWLIDTIIDHSNPQEEHWVWFPGDELSTPMERRKGLPIGNLTSQFWGNVYLNRLDHFVKEELRVPGYIRYVDDFVLLGKEKAEIANWKEQISQFLGGLRLIPHPTKTQIHQTRDGIPFLGFQVFPRYRYVRKEKVKRYRRHLRKSLDQINKKTMSTDELEHKLNSWNGHIGFGQSQRLKEGIVLYIENQGLLLLETPSGSWRVLEQYR